MRWNLGSVVVEGHLSLWLDTFQIYANFLLTWEQIHPSQSWVTHGAQCSRFVLPLSTRAKWGRSSL